MIKDSYSDEDRRKLLEVVKKERIEKGDEVF